MAKQIKNRREDLYINDVPPEILDETTLSEDGFVKNTDYPTNTKAGVIKLTGNTYGVRASADGQLYGAPFTLAQYNNGSGNLFVTKTTLENVIGSLITKAIADMCGALDSDDVGTTYTMQCVEKTADGYTFVGGKTAPITP